MELNCVVRAWQNQAQELRAILRTKGGSGDLETNKAPLIVTLVLAIVGWAVAHTVDRITAAPTIEFDTETYNRHGQNIFVVKLINLSFDRAFRDLLLQLQASSGGRITDFNILPVEPGFEGNEPTHVLPTGDAWFSFAEIQPEGTFFARAVYTGDPPRVRISLKDGTARIVTGSLETFLVQWEIVIFAVLIAFGILFLSGYALWQGCRRKPPPEPLTVRIV